MKPVHALVLTLALTSAPLPALASGALAVGETGNIARDGVSVGVSEDRATRAEAREEALQICRTAEGVSQAARNKCTIVQDFQHGCVSVYADKQPRTPGFGWGYASTPLRAKWDALYACREAAGSGGTCELIGTSCD